MRVNWAEYFGSKSYSLPFAHFGSSKLKYNVFAEIKLSKFDFTGCSILESTFSGCDLSGANFNGCALDNTEFYHCDATGADFRDTSGYRIDIMSNKLKNARFSYPDAINLLSGLGIKIE